MSVTALIQARMGSSRVPGKSLRNLCGRPVIHHVWDRVHAAAGIDVAVVATSTHAADDPLAVYCAAQGIPCARGDEQNVAERFAVALRQFPGDHVVRICGDQPLQTPAIVARVVAEHLAAGVEFTFTGHYDERSYPLGTDVAVMTAVAFARCQANHHRISAHPDNPFQYRDEHPDEFRTRLVCAPAELRVPELRFALDYEEDFQLIEQIYSRWYTADPLFGVEKAIVQVHEDSALQGLMTTVAERLRGIRKERAGKIW